MKNNGTDLEMSHDFVRRLHRSLRPHAGEVQAIGEHGHVPEIIAATLENYLLHCERGPETVRDMMVDDIRSAVKRHDVPHARQLVSVLRHFLHEHPDATVRGVISQTAS